MFKSLGLLPRDDVVCATGLSLQAGYVGQTSGKVEALMRQAKGEGVVFGCVCVVFFLLRLHY